MSASGLGLNSNTLKGIERILFLVGVVLIGTYVGALLHRVVGARVGIWQLQNANAATPPGTTSPASTDENLDVSLWSGKRIQAYKESLARHFDPPLGMLRLPRLRLAVPIFEGTDDLTLNRGVGRVAGTAQLGEIGNAAIAGHRDGFFRVLKDIQVGDAMELQAGNRTLKYEVRSTEIVVPSSTEVLRSGEESELTLVTCYPFYFVGSAPQRFIVHAFLLRTDKADSNRQSAKNESR